MSTKHQNAYTFAGCVGRFVLWCLVLGNLWLLPGCAATPAGDVFVEPDAVEPPDHPPYTNFKFKVDDLIGDADRNGIVLAFDIGLTLANLTKRIEDNAGELTVWARPGGGDCRDYLAYATVYAEPIDPNHPTLVGVTNVFGLWHTRTPPRWRLRELRVEEEVE